jgi:hypothetical protein
MSRSAADPHPKGGKVYFYFRRHGKRTPLPGRIQLAGIS